MRLEINCNYHRYEYEVNMVAYNNIANNRLVDKVRLISLYATKESLSALKQAMRKFEMYHLRLKGAQTAKRFRSYDKIYASLDKKTDYYHVLLLANDGCGNDTLFMFKGNDYIDWNVNPDTIPNIMIDKVYNKLNQSLDFPVLKEWIPKIIEEAISKNNFIRCLVDNETDVPISCYYLDWSRLNLETRISNWLKSGEITLGSGRNSEFMSSVTGVEDYLNHYYKELSRKIEASFVPRFNPDTDDYSPALEHLCEYLSYAKKIDLYGAQKATVQAASNALDDKKCIFIVGEQGTGKTLMSTATAYTNNADKKFMTNVVMCPGQLVEKWSREIGRIPNSKAVIISSFDDLIETVPKIRAKNRHYHLWLVISKETAKFDYNLRPAGIYKKVPVFINEAEMRSVKRYQHYEYGGYEEKYVCPSCGKPVYYAPALGPFLFLNKYGFDEPRRTYSNSKIPNTVCPHCHSSLWQPAEKCGVDHESKWVYITKASGEQTKIGWMERRFVKSEYERILNSDRRTKEEKAMILPLKRTVDELFAPINVGGAYGVMDREDIKAEYKKLTTIENPSDEDVENLKLIDSAMDVIRRAATGYPVRKNMAIGSYIYRKFKREIDYAIIDEVHELKGRDTLQGEAFAQITRAARKTICLTGTLTNGEASSLFWMLYRTVPRMMKKNGFDYNAASEKAFVEKYGVMEETVIREERKRKTKRKELPGISPAVFTDFLMENAVFVSLDDMSENLPGYEEIPMGVDMDDELKTQYNRIVESVRTVFTGENAQNRSGGIKSYGQVLQGLMTFPDQPYDQPPILNLETQTELIEMPELNRNTLRNKDRALIKLIREKKVAGEKVLVYYSYPGRCDHLPDTLKTELKALNISFAELTSSVSAAKREEWIANRVEKKNIDVLLCNPELVKTGLDLLPFTTIVFYQPVINLSTMMQASRRSWRIGQTRDVQVYFMYYRGTVQEAATSTQASRKQAAMVIQGKFNVEGLEAMANESSIAIRLINDLVEGVEQDETRNKDVFKSARIESRYKARENTDRWMDKHYKLLFKIRTIKNKKNYIRCRDVANYNDLKLAIC